MVGKEDGALRFGGWKLSLTDGPGHLAVDDSTQRGVILGSSVRIESYGVLVM